jgi:hypothetical protein
MQLVGVGGVRRRRGLHKMADRILRKITEFNHSVGVIYDRPCGLVVSVPGHRCRSPGSIPGLPDFLRSSGSRTGPTQPREYN